MSIEIQAELERILDKYADKVNESVDDVAGKIASDTAKDLKQTSPRKSGKYAKGWAVKKDGSGRYIVHNKTDYQLTHLLNNGHVVANQYGTYGRTTGDNHIGKAADKYEREFIDELTNRIEQQ